MAKGGQILSLLHSPGCIQLPGVALSQAVNTHIRCMHSTALGMRRAARMVDDAPCLTGPVSISSKASPPGHGLGRHTGLVTHTTCHHLILRGQITDFHPSEEMFPTLRHTQLKMRTSAAVFCTISLVALK